MTMTTYKQTSPTVSPLVHVIALSNRAHVFLRSVLERLGRAISDHYRDERGMSTIEYALGCVAAAALGALLYTVVTSDTVEQALSGIFERALNEGN
ncbi:DUF4244 domain-containing protein [Corynebacterium urogenitale]